MMTKTKWVLGILLLCLSLINTVSACPDWQAAPHFGTIDLGAGFQPDPFVRSLTAGGTINLRHCFQQQNWSGYVTTRPDLDLRWHGNSRRLTIAVESNADTVLLINSPDGRWHYNDDHRGLNPAIIFYNPQAGLYDIWIGSYDGSRRNPARLVITEYDY